MGPCIFGSNADKTLSIPTRQSRMNFKIKNLFFILSSLVLSILWLLYSSNEEQLIVFPILLGAYIFLLFILMLKRRDNVWPLFDIGSIYLLAVTFYYLIPLLQFLFSGLTHTALSPVQLFYHNPTADHISKFSFWYAAYALSFAVAYLVIRRKNEITSGIKITYDAFTFKIFVMLFIIFNVIKYFTTVAYGLDLNVAYDPVLVWEAYEDYGRMPLLLRQIFHNFNGTIEILKIGIFIYIFTNWNKKLWKSTLFLWLLFLVVEYVFKMGARTELFLAFFYCILLFHRVIRPIKLKKIVFAGAIFIMLFLVFGHMRGGKTISGNIDKSLSLLEQNKGSVFLMANEFQTVFAGGYDLYTMTESETIKDSPWQFHTILYDIILLIPQQILPFEKPDVQNWYIKVTKTPYPGYFMFNPIAQSIMGLGIIEVFIRGALLGLIFALIHNWYLCDSESLWKTLFYLWMISVAYMNIRSSNFTFLYFIIYRFIPIYMLVYILQPRNIFSPKPYAMKPSEEI